MNLNTKTIADDAAQRCRRISEGLKVFTAAVTEFSSHQKDIPVFRSTPESVVRGFCR